MESKEQECKQEDSTKAISVLEARVCGSRNRHNGSTKKGSN